MADTLAESVKWKDNATQKGEQIWTASRMSKRCMSMQRENLVATRKTWGARALA